MYLRPSKKYTKRRVHLFNLRWLWLYLIAPVIIIPAVILWQNRATISTEIGKWADKNIKINVAPAPTATATIPPVDLLQRYNEFVQAGNLSNAISTLWSLAEASPNDVNLYARLTRMIVFRGDPDDKKRQDDALKAAYGAINANPETAAGYVMVGLALNSGAEPKAREALPYLLRARDFDDRDPMTLAVMAETYLNLDRAERARELIDQAIEYARAAPQVDAGALAYAHVVQGNILSLSSGQDAIKAYEEAWRVGQSDPALPLGFVATWIQAYYINTTDSTRLVDVLTRAAQRDKDDMVLPYLTALTYQKFGDVPKAQRFLERCLDLNPNYSKCLRVLGVIMLNSDNPQRASELGQRIIDQGTDDPRAYLLAGYAYALINKCVQAVPLLQKGLSLKPAANVQSQLQQALQLCGASSNPIAAPTATPEASQ